MNKETLGVWVFITFFLIISTVFGTLFATKIYNGYKEKDFRQFVHKAMDNAHAQLSPAKQEVITESLIRVSNQIFSTQEQKEVFVALVAVESAFNPEATSKAGAVGLTQVMPKFASGFSKQCGLPELQEKDLKDITINLQVGACAFKTLIQANAGKTTLALIGYNSGPSGNPTKQLKNGVNITNTEAASYAVKVSHMLDRTRTGGQ